MIKDVSLRLSPETAMDNDAVLKMASKQANVSVADITAMRAIRRSVDARRNPPVIDMQVRLFCNEEEDSAFEKTTYPQVQNGKSVIVVGAGPAGLFAALRLIEMGLKPIILERGKDVHQRKKDIALLNLEKVVNEESNYSFGEGGAGAFSDGKLYTRATKRGNVNKVLSQFCQHGASTDILFDAHPHIGTDKLPSVVEQIRKTIIASGGVVHFSSKVVSFLTEGDQLVGIVTDVGMEFRGPVILATGHSARDMYEYLDKSNIAIEAKALAIGVRLEHPQGLIDRIQYKNTEGRGKYLPPAEYSFVTQVKDRGVYSFCMCPGGFVIPASTAEGQLVVNGMSTSSRHGEYANSGMVVELHPEDLPQDQFGGKLGMMKFQEALERRCFKAGGSNLCAPSQRMVDFVNHRVSKDVPASSYIPGLANADLHHVLPSFISERLATAFSVFGRQAHKFLTNDAVLIAAETRTSSPVRILRDKETNMHVQMQGLFPCGEGAGYAGGIVSAALDGINCAESVARYLGC
ncbi:FAD-dependent dehydrogenase [Sphaerochaeta pleomorpha str. Grapes]|uniref:FAD-dependent dehydrogenase n=1 Tax=Sphaerochaeta pleomorpha (strain ATCC BAA-1885 / DSM 22778 / Grapes) TaxID=158190 RepID=G8QQV6_SPHPG|nr:NAD(P)/FAD-dependent oxidoreductase [Sphaerochaeta pleomorpha]AEV28737.1 FAD-dependent dehydrogenase [Sphaerochaeta pleomorpha str. Grapes]